MKRKKVSWLSFRTSIAGVGFKHCIMNAAGPRCVTEEELHALGTSHSAAIVTKSMTKEFREGNPKPRYYSTDLGSINSSGLPNLGYKEYVKLIPTLTRYKKPIIASISGLCLDDNLEMIKALNNTPSDLIELNLSCPNIVGKPQIGYDMEQTDAVLQKVMSIVKKPLGVKLPPYFDIVHFEQIAAILNKHKVQFVSCINSVGNGIIIDPEKEEVTIKPKRGFGGIGGKYVKPTALANVNKFYELLDSSIDIFGVGGIFSGVDVFEHILAGAKAVQLATVFYEEQHDCLRRIESEFNAYMEKKGYSSIHEVRGKLKTM